MTCCKAHAQSQSHAPQGSTLTLLKQPGKVLLQLDPSCINGRGGAADQHPAAVHNLDAAGARGILDGYQVAAALANQGAKAVQQLMWDGHCRLLGYFAAAQ